MTKIRIEWPEGPGRCRETRAEVGYSRLGNHYINFQGQVYVWKEQKIGEPVLSKVNGKWQVVGRVAHQGLFIGGQEQQTFDEWSRTLEGKAQLEKDLRQMRESFLIPRQ